MIVQLLIYDERGNNEMVYKIKSHGNIILKIGVISILVFFMCSCSNDQNNQAEVQEERIIQEDLTPATDIYLKYGISVEVSEEVFTNFDIIPDEKTAKEVAKSILIPIYGKKDIKEQMPFEVIYDSEYDAWVISGTLKSNMIGGVATIIIQKSDGKVLAVSHSR